MPDEVIGSFDSSGAFAVARVEFQGDWNGVLTVRMAAPVLARLAADMLGEDGADFQEAMRALGEIANVICGHCLPELCGTERVFELATPVAGSATDDFDELIALVQLGGDAIEIELRRKSTGVRAA